MPKLQLQTSGDVCAVLAHTLTELLMQGVCVRNWCVYPFITFMTMCVLLRKGWLFSHALLYLGEQEEGLSLSHALLYLGKQEVFA